MERSDWFKKKGKNNNEMFPVVGKAVWSWKTDF